MSGRKVHVRIDALVLRGVAPGDRDGIAAALRTELGRLLAEDAGAGAFTEGRSAPALRLDSVRVAAGEPASRIGRSAARRVAKGIRG